MNLRVLKKLSKRAAPLLPLLGDRREQFRAETGENYTKSVIKARKHWERFGGVHPSHYPLKEISPGRIYFKARSGRIVSMSNEYIHPRKGTVMVGAVSGYYEPEWDEETAWDALSDIVYWHFADFDFDAHEIRHPRSLNTPSEVFAAAQEMLGEAEAERARRLGAARRQGRPALCAGVQHDGGCRDE